MDWTPVIVAFVPIILLYMNQRASRQAAREAALAAAKAEESATLAATTAYQTSAKVDGVAEQLDGRITQFMEEMKKRTAEAYTAGAAAGRTAALRGAIATKIDKVQEHLTKQDQDLETRHKANGEPRKPVTLTAATEDTVEAAQHANALAKKKGKPKK